MVEVSFRGLVCFVVALALAGTAQASGDNPARLQPLRDDCVQIRVSAETRALTRDERDALTSHFLVPDMCYIGDALEGREGDCEGGAAAKGGDPKATGVLCICFWLEEKSEGIGLISQVATRAPHDWEGSVRIDWRGADYFRQRFQGGEEGVKRFFEVWRKHEQIAKERPVRFNWVVLPDAGSTVGDALQTVVDVLGMKVRVMPKLAGAYAPDWEKVLDVPLNATDAQRRDGLSLRALIDHVARRLGGVAEINRDVLFVDGEEAAAEHRREREELDKRLKGTKWELIFVKFLPIVVDEHPKDADDGHRPAQDDEDSPPVAPE